MAKKEDIELTEVPTVHIGIRPNTVQNTFELMLGIPSTGVVRYEWQTAVMSLVIPVVFAQKTRAAAIGWSAPIGFHVAEARNLIVKDFINSKCEWLFFLDHDVLPTQDLYIRLLEYMRKKEHPIVSGLYYVKAEPAYPLLFRGRGTSSYLDWKPGDLVEVDGIPMGCTLIHRSILEYMYKNSRELQTRTGEIVREVFTTPRELWLDPQSMSWGVHGGTEDLWWCDRVIKEKVLWHTGWRKHHKKKYPFIVDTGMFCKHISYEGKQYPVAA